MPLYLVATPIGNLGDITQRAKDALAQSQILAAEDTRSALRLLNAYNIPLPGRQLLSYGEHNEKQMAPKLAAELAAGKDVALLTDGGTPLVSDPGYRLVQAAIEAGVQVVPLPGPCAAIAALSASGLAVHGVLFRGFLPKKPGARRRILDSLKDREETLIFYESPQRVVRLAAELAEVFGPTRRACMARELTKLHETFLRLPLGELAARLEADEQKAPIKGEITVLVEGLGKAEDAADEPDDA